MEGGLPLGEVNGIRLWVEGVGRCFCVLVERAVGEGSEAIHQTMVLFKTVGCYLIHSPVGP